MCTEICEGGFTHENKIKLIDIIINIFDQLIE